MQTFTGIAHDKNTKKPASTFGEQASFSIPAVRSHQHHFSLILRQDLFTFYSALSRNKP